MHQPEQSGQTRRRRINPFLRKPLWAILDEEHHQPASASASAPATTSLSKRNNCHSVDGNEHEGTDGIELPARADRSNTSENARGFSLEYSDDDEEEEKTNNNHDNQNVNNDNNQRHHPHTHLPRHLTLFDLVSIGVGGTIGSGIFVLNGLIAHEYAGPATFLSWIISGVAALLSGCCYAELSGRIPSAGSSYAYAFCALGELPAFVTAGMLSLEFLLSGSAVARSWGDKVVEWLRVELSVSERTLVILEPGYGINPMACLVSIATTMLVLGGVKESKLVTDFFTWTKVLLVIFMIVGGFTLMDTSNFQPLVPPEFGSSGVLRGAVSSFFGYLGFDAVCCVAGEAINADVNLPRSIIITLCIVTSLYVTAAISLVGMQHYTEISPESGFPEAFKARGVEWASQLTAAGEVFTLPVVVLISVMIQPRLQFALANDGLLPPMFGEIDSSGNPRKGALFAGALMTIFATFVPFSYLDDFVSAGILVAFTITNCSLVIMRRESPEANPFLLEKLLAWFNLISFLTCLVLSHGMKSPIGWIAAPILGLVSLSTAIKISRQCPPLSSFGKANESNHQIYGNKTYFATPFVPYLPCLGMFANYFLISQLSFMGICLLIIYAMFAVALYFSYGAHNSIGSTEGWEKRQYSVVEAHDNETNCLSATSNNVTGKKGVMA